MLGSHSFLSKMASSMKEEVVRLFECFGTSKYFFDGLYRKVISETSFLSEGDLIKRLGQSLFRNRGAEIYIPGHILLVSTKTSIALR